MFQFTALAHCSAVCNGRAVTGSPIRTFAGRSAFAARRNFSQLITSFFASESQGIRRVPFFAFLFSFICRSRSSLNFELYFASIMSMSSLKWRITDSNR